MATWIQLKEKRLFEINLEIANNDFKEIISTLITECVEFFINYNPTRTVSSSVQYIRDLKTKIYEAHNQVIQQLMQYISKLEEYKINCICNKNEIK